MSVLYLHSDRHIENRHRYVAPRELLKKKYILICTTATQAVGLAKKKIWISELIWPLLPAILEALDIGLYALLQKAGYTAETVWEFFMLLANGLDAESAEILLTALKWEEEDV